ncbi:MAG: hypothetical protein GXO26_08025 [Crenarchaeota archaeon]|nr:hypothetical protein [Thermoproteota archaeon]
MTDRLHPKYREVSELLRKFSNMCNMLNGRQSYTISILSGEEDMIETAENIEEIENILSKIFRTGRRELDFTIEARCFIDNGVVPITDLENMMNMSMKVIGNPRMTILWRGKRYDYGNMDINCRIDYATYMMNRKRETYYDYMCMVINHE